MTHLTQDIYGVVVPKASFDYTILSTCIYFNIPFGNGIGFNKVEVENTEDLRILGTASPEEITFDCEDFVEQSIEGTEYKYGGELHPKEYYWDYDCKSYSLESSNQSFLSIIESKGIILKPNDKLLILKKL